MLKAVAGSSAPASESALGKSPSPDVAQTQSLLKELSEDQLEEYKYLLSKLGEFPDKVQINVLTMIADDFAASYPHSSSALYRCIRDLLVSIDVSPSRKLPLVYVIDSILKNARGNYIALMKVDIPLWMPIVHETLSSSSQYDVAKQKLRKVWNTWKEFNIFSDKDWREMGTAFTKEDERIKSSKLIADVRAKAGGISRSADGTLILSSDLRKHMQDILDDIQRAENVDELSKVSLERLADINQELLLEIKKAAEEILASNEKQVPTKIDSGGYTMNQSTGGIFPEIRPPHILERVAEWEHANVNLLEHSSEIITKLNGYVKMGTNPNSFKDENESKWLLQYRHINMNDLLGSSSACATILTSMLERVRIQESSSNNNSTATVSFQNRSTNGSYTYMTSQPKGSAQLGVDKIFTAESLKEKNEWVIERLYHVGLPFMSSTDGRRFATQAELTAHLDGLFKKRLLEKSMERNEERGWYPSVIIWSGQQTSGSKEVGDGSGTRDTNTMSLAATGNDDLSITATVTADESRDRCVLCGLNFTMFFDQEEGEWKYKNCHEVEVLNSDAVGETGSDLMLVHVSCLRGLGSPHVLYLDQIVPTAAIGKY